MSTITETRPRVITPEQYTALHAPVPPPSPIELFEFERARLSELRLAKIADFDKFAKRLPSGLFVLVPVQPAVANKMDWKELMPRIQYEKKSGVKYLDVSAMEDLGEVPSVPVLLRGVEDGRARLNVKPSVSRANIASEKRNAFLTWWGFLLVAFFPHILKDRGFDCVGSRYGSDDCPRFCLRDGEPALGNFWEGSAYSRWGAPSCESVES